MACNGWNHGPNCDCGWGGQWHGNIPYGGGGVAHISRSNPTINQGAAKPLSPRPDFHSFTIPNASCPVCGGSVFFYQNSFGSRVFFDELGPPWPKHPCTDNGNWNRPSQQQIFEPQVAKPRHRADWRENGWSPFIILAVEGNELLLQSIRDCSETWIRLDRKPPKCELKIAYCAKQEGIAGALVSILNTNTFEPEQYRAYKSNRSANLELTGFKLFCERERRLGRKIDAARELASIREYNFSWRELPWWKQRIGERAAAGR